MNYREINKLAAERGAPLSHDVSSRSDVFISVFESGVTVGAFQFSHRSRLHFVQTRYIFSQAAVCVCVCVCASTKTTTTIRTAHRAVRAADSAEFIDAPSTDSSFLFWVNSLDHHVWLIGKS